LATAGGGTGRRFLSLYKNGSQIGTSQVEFTATSSAIMDIQTSAILNLAVADYIELFIYQNSGGSINSDAAISFSSCQYLEA